MSHSSLSSTFLCTSPNVLQYLRYSLFRTLHIIFSACFSISCFLTHFPGPSSEFCCLEKILPAFSPVCRSCAPLCTSKVNLLTFTTVIARLLVEPAASVWGWSLSSEPSMMRNPIAKRNASSWEKAEWFPQDLAEHRDFRNCPPSWMASFSRLRSFCFLLTLTGNRKF